MIYRKASYFVAVTADALELPLVSERTKADISRALDVDYHTIEHALKTGCISRNKFAGSHYRIIEVEDEDESTML